MCLKPVLARKTGWTCRDRQEKTQTRRTPDAHETHRKVGMLTFNFAGSSRSPPVPKTWKQSAKRGGQFSWLSGSWAALAGLQKFKLPARCLTLASVARQSAV